MAINRNASNSILDHSISTLVRVFECVTTCWMLTDREIKFIIATGAARACNIGQVADCCAIAIEWNKKNAMDENGNLRLAYWCFFEISIVHILAAQLI